MPISPARVPRGPETTVRRTGTKRRDAQAPPEVGPIALIDEFCCTSFRPIEMRITLTLLIVFAAPMAIWAAICLCRQFHLAMRAWPLP